MSTVKVIAPGDLSEGYVFDAQLEGKTFKVTVPKGGVTAGQEFEVPSPTDDDFTPLTVVATPMGNAQYGDLKEGVKGRWRYGLCDCCSTCCCPFWMGWCFPFVFAGQIFQRFGLTFTGGKSFGGGHENTCQIMTGIFLADVALYYILQAALPQTVELPGADGNPRYTTQGAQIAGIISSFVYLYFLVAMIRARMAFRKKYDIPGDCCGDGCCGDCCCMYWCSCCALLQMHRQTHDEHQYRYNCCTNTGLDRNAPSIV